MKMFRFVALAGVSALSLSTPAFAQDGSPEEGASEDERIIIVQARRRDEDVQEVPQVINAVTAETIQNLNIRNATEITSVVPGLSLTVNANGIGSSSSMRGINHDVNVSGENGTIQYYVNDVPVASNFALQAIFDVGQISVERGPQGTLRGRSTPSGAININWRKPNLSEPGGYVTASLGSDDASNINFGIGVPIWQDKLAVRVAGLIDRNRGSRIRSVNNTTEPTSRIEAIRAMAQFEPVEWLKLGFVYQGMKTRATQYDQVQSMSDVIPGFVAPGPVQTISPPLPFTTLVGAGLPSAAGSYGTITPEDRLSTQFAPRTTFQSFKYYGWNAEADLAGQRLIYVGSKLSFVFNPVTNQDIGAIFPALTLQQNTFTTSKGETHEIRLQNDDRIADMFDYVVGYFRSSGAPETRLTSPSTIRGYFPLTPPTVPIPAGFTLLQGVTGFIGIGTPIYLPPGKTTEESYFGNVTLHLGDATELSAGLRNVNFESRSAGLFISCTPTQFAAGTCVLTPGTANSYDVSKTIYNASIRHKFNDNFMVYAATGTSFRPPVRAIGNFSTAYSPLEIAHTSFGPETSTSYELGFKSAWLDKALRFNATFYHQDFKDYPFRASGAGVYFINIDASGAPGRSQFNFISKVPVKVDGVEAELFYNPSERFKIGATLNWSTSKVGNAKVACTDALNNGTGAVGSDGIPDTVAPSLAQMQAAYGTEHLAECNARGSATFLPEWSGTVQAEYNLPVNDWASIYVRGLLTWRGSTENDPYNPYDNTGSYGIFNLYGGFRGADGDWELGVYAKNLGNTTRLLQGNDNVYTQNTNLINLATSRPFGSTLYSSNYRGISVTAPREVGVNLRVSFGGN
jgi:iron complex outermembrane receptor protein